MNKVSRIEQAVGIEKIKSYIEIGMQPFGNPMLRSDGQVVLVMVKWEEEQDVTLKKKK